MTRVFLSFASEDSSAARLIAEFFEELGVEVFRFDDTRRQVGRVVGQMEEQLGAADLFIALVSRHYFASAWCTQERDRCTSARRRFAHPIDLCSEDH